MTYSDFGRTSQIRTGDLYHVNIDGCTNVHSSMRILTLYASIESLQILVDFELKYLPSCEREGLGFFIRS